MDLFFAIGVESDPAAGAVVVEVAAVSAPLDDDDAVEFAEAASVEAVVAVTDPTDAECA